MRLQRQQVTRHDNSTGYNTDAACLIPAEVTEEFLTFSANNGNDLRQIGLKGGW